MNKVTPHTKFPFFDRDEFLTAFDPMFDELFKFQFPDIVKTVGVNPISKSAYPKVNIYEWNNKIGLIAEIPGLKKDDLNIDIENNVLIISGNKHNVFDIKGAKIHRQELKQSSFKRSFELGDRLNVHKISAKFIDGILSIEIPIIKPETPKVTKIKIS